MSDDTTQRESWIQLPYTQRLAKVFKKRLEEKFSTLLRAAASSTDPKVTKAYQDYADNKVIVAMLEEGSSG